MSSWIFTVNLYLYKIESLNFGRRDLGNDKSHQDMLYTNSFSMIRRWSETHSDVNQVIMTAFPGSQRNVVFTGLIFYTNGILAHFCKVNEIVSLF